MEQINCGISISGNKIRCCIAHYDKREAIVTVAGAGDSDHSAVQNGEINDFELLSDAIVHAVNEAKKAARIKRIHTVYTNISGSALRIDSSEGMWRLGSLGRPVRKTDIEKVIDVAKAWPLTYHYDILHVIPQVFSLDGQKDIRNPLGLFGIRLEVNTCIISAHNAAIRNLSNVCRSAGYDLKDVIFGGLATSYAITDRSERAQKYIVIDVGWDLTDIVIYDRNLIRHVATLPSGTQYLLESLQRDCLLSPEQAESALRNINFLDKTEPSIGNNESEAGSQKKQVEIALAWRDALLKDIENVLFASRIEHISDFKIRMTGEISFMDNFIDHCESYFQTQVTQGYLVGMHSNIETHIPVAFASAIGLIKYIAELEQERIDFKYERKKGSSMLFEKIRYVFSEFF